MDCLEFRRQCATEPTRKGAALLAHESECAACLAFARETAALDKRIMRAMQVPLPASLQNFSVDDSASPAPTSRVQRAQKTWRSVTTGGWLALAASIVAAALVSIGVWRAATPESLGSELVAHVRHEPMSLLPVAEPVTAAGINLVLRRTGARVEAPLGTVSYIRSCPFRNKEVAHVVIEGSTGPVTLLLLPHVSVATATAFEEDGFKGTIVPVGKGSVAIIGSETEPLDAVEKLVSSAVAWQI